MAIDRQGEEGDGHALKRAPRGCRQRSRQVTMQPAGGHEQSAYMVLVRGGSPAGHPWRVGWFQESLCRAAGAFAGT
jgi:hypothetical protein